MKHAKIKFIIFLPVIALVAFVPALIGKGQIKNSTASPVDSALYNIYKSDSLAIETAKFAWSVDSVKRDLNGLSLDIYANKTTTSEIKYWVRNILKKQKERETKVPYYVPIPTAVNNSTIEKKIIVKQFKAPKYEGTKCRTYLTYFEWKKTRGIFDSKDLKTYNKYYEAHKVN